MTSHELPEELREAFAFTSALADRGITFRLRGTRLSVIPAKRYHELSDEDRTSIRKLRPAIKTLAAGGLLPAVSDPQTEAPPVREAQRKEEPTPEVWAYGVRITEAHVTTVLTSLGMLEAYASGRLTKLEAYDMARRRERQAQELLGRYYPR
jgi:hypothetical protein